MADWSSLMVALVTAPLGGAVGVALKNRADARLAKQGMNSQQQKDDSTALARAFEALNGFVTAQVQAMSAQVVQMREELNREIHARHEAEKKQLTAESERRALGVENEHLKKQTSLLEGSVNRLTSENTLLREKVAALETDVSHLRFELSGEKVGLRVMPPAVAPET
jgi:predicted  nucleic acid-binding Zn-ribbon protein